MTNELKSTTEICRYPRFNSLANVQPALFDSFLGPGTPLFNVGLTARNAAIILTPNFDPSGRRPPMSIEEQTLVPFSIAIAARKLTSFGCWTEEGVDQDKVKTEFGCDEELVDAEKIELEFLINQFESFNFGKTQWDMIKQVEQVELLNARNAAERCKAQQSNKVASGRFYLTHSVPPAPDDGKKPKLPDGFAAAKM